MIEGKDYWIKHKDGLWVTIYKFIPELKDSATTLGSYIFMPDWYFNDESRSVVEKEAILEHEKIHVDQWLKNGFSFVVDYLFSTEKRKYYELKAYEVQVKYIVHKGMVPVPESWARAMCSGYSILTWISYEEALPLVKTWIAEEQASCQ